jgi:uncharacterized protein (DUF433 family)
VPLSGQLWSRVRLRVRLWPVDDAFLMLPADRVAQIAGISRQRLEYWEKSGLVRPTHRKIVHRHLTVRLYDLADLTVVAIAAELVRQSGISLQHVRKTRGRLLSRAREPLRDLRWAVIKNDKSDKRELWVQYPDGSWEGDKAPPGQVNILDEGTLDLKVIRAKVEDKARKPIPRDVDAVGRVEKRKSVRHAAPVFGGTRIPVAAVWEFIDEGAPDREILEAFPSLKPADLNKARLLRRVARKVRAGTLAADELPDRFPDLTDDEIRSIRQLTRVA